MASGPPCVSSRCGYLQDDEHRRIDHEYDLIGAIPGVSVLVGIVVVLANLNFWLNFCLGCWMYYRLNRLGVPGFQAVSQTTTITEER